MKKLILERAKNDDYLIIADEKGNPIKVKARKYLKLYKK
jgi:hypothetical protein